jgi:hypothetical protein
MKSERRKNGTVAKPEKPLPVNRIGVDPHKWGT